MPPITNETEKNEELKTRLYIFAAVPFFFFILFIAVLFSLQVLRGSQYALKAKTNREQFSILPAIRGVVYDRTGKNILAINRRSFAVTIVPQNLPKDKDRRNRLIKKLAVLLKMSTEDINAIINQKSYSQYGTYVIKTDVPFRDIAFLAEHNRDFPGVYWKSKPLRVYPNGDMLSHVIGYVGMISQKEYFNLSDQGYNIESIIGKSGIEKVYDRELKGKDGYVRRIVDATNQVTAEIIDRDAEPIPGKNIVLTIDRDVQRLAEQALGERTGAVVVSRPSTGEVLAMVSYPRFDPNFFVRQTSKEVFKKLALDKRKPFLNRAIQAQYPAGSVFKLVVALAALDSGKVPPDREFTCGGGYQLGNRFFSCWKNHGRVDLYKAIVESCDSYFYQISLILGPELIAEYARKFGLGHRLGIDLLGEVEGTVPDEAWKKEVKGDMWYDGDTLNLSIGQGYLLVTPLQINVLTNLIANNGVLMKPYIVSEVHSAKTGELVYRRKPEVLIDTKIDPQYFNFIQRAMRGVVTDGTAKWGGAVLAVDAAGKTSTSEVLGQLTHSWYTAFAPFGSGDKNDLISVTAIVEHAGAGSAIAAPLVSEILEAYFACVDLDTAKRNIWIKRAQARKNSQQG